MTHSKNTDQSLCIQCDQWRNSYTMERMPIFFKKGKFRLFGKPDLYTPVAIIEKFVGGIRTWLSKPKFVGKKLPNDFFLALKPKGIGNAKWMKGLRLSHLLFWLRDGFFRRSRLHLLGQEVELSRTRTLNTRQNYSAGFLAILDTHLCTIRASEI
jgi:hypothetical protein